MSVCGVTHPAAFDGTFPEETHHEITYEYADGGFYYTVAHSARGREFVSLPGLTAIQVQKLVEKEGISFFPPENFDGNESFAFTHGWQIGSNKVGIVAEDGLLSCTVHDGAGAIIHDEEIPQKDSHGKALPAGEIYCKFLQASPLVQPDGKASFFFFSQLDPTIAIDRSRWAVTLVNSTPICSKWPFGHAVLLIEKVSKSGQHKMRLAHFIPNKYRSGKKRALTGVVPGEVKYEKEKYTSYSSKTETWSLPRDNIKQMIHEIKEEIKTQSLEGIDDFVFFSGRGKGTLFMPAFIQTPGGQSRVENCLTWSINKLLKHGAVLYHLPEGTFLNQPVTYISSYKKLRKRKIEKDLETSFFGRKPLDGEREQRFVTSLSRETEILPAKYRLLLKAMEIHPGIGVCGYIVESTTEALKKFKWSPVSSLGVAIEGIWHLM